MSQGNEMLCFITLVHALQLQCGHFVWCSQTPQVDKGYLTLCPFLRHFDSVHCSEPSHSQRTTLTENMLHKISNKVSNAKLV